MGHSGIGTVGSACWATSYSYCQNGFRVVRRKRTGAATGAGPATGTIACEMEAVLILIPEHNMSV